MKTLQWVAMTLSAGQQTDAVPATSTGFAFSLFAAVEIDSSETFPNPPGSSSSKSFGIGERRIPAFAILTFGKAVPFRVGSLPKAADGLER